MSRSHQHLLQQPKHLSAPELAQLDGGAAWSITKVEELDT